MDTSTLLIMFRESLFFVIVFSVLLIYGMVRGRFALINGIFGLYIGFLISLTFPYYQTLKSVPLKIGLFFLFVILGTILIRRHVPGNDYEAAFESIGKKLILAFLASILVMIFSFNVFPASEIVHLSTPIQSLFASSEYFFWWLILPLVSLFFL